MIRDALAGKRIGVTGSTGFLGTALVERLLSAVPGCEVVLLVRPGARSTAQTRVQREVLRNDAFNPLRARLGDGFDDEVARRVQVIAGDVASDGLGLDDAGRAVFATCDIVIHSAATVAFDSPLDQAVEVNLLGGVRVAEAIRAAGSNAHLVAVSTCYVAGNRRGAAPEQLVSDGPFDLGVDWRTEVAAARRLRADLDADSREPAMLARFRAGARTELGAAGTPLLAAKTEQLRERWVSDRLVERGRARASSLGWPDAYAYTKALGEGALTGAKGEVPVNIVRPSIIESAVHHPYPGWIRGFRMAEPVIIAYARGLLRQFPGVPEGTIDVIPVDHVVGAICAVAAVGPAEAPPIVQVASGAVNPLRYRTLTDTVREWFHEHPIYDAEGQPILPAEFEFPGRGKVEGQLRTAKRAITTAERALQNLPLRGKQADWSAKLEERRTQVERALDYVQLYGSYTECEAIYGVERLYELWGRLDDDDREEFWFDPREVDWVRYIRDTHLPSVVETARVKTNPGKTRTNRDERLRRNVLDPKRHLAVFDLENTLIASNVVESYSFLATRRLHRNDKARFVVRQAAEAPALWKLDRKDRGDFLRWFYRRYEGAPVEQIRADSAELFSRIILAKSFPAGFRRVREHRALGHRTLLITGALDFVVEPLRHLFDDIVAARLAVAPDGTYAGELREVPPTGESRAQLMADYATANGFDLAESIAYADSTSDLPMLEAVGFPVAVNPETRLAAIARKRGWLVEHWSKAGGAPRPPLPISWAKWRPGSTPPPPILQQRRPGDAGSLHNSPGGGVSP